MTSVLIAGLSARAAAASAARAGFTVTALDAFDDLDRHPSVRGFSLPRDFGAQFSPRAAARAARGLECDAVVYLSNFENHPPAVEKLSAGRQLWGNPPDVLRRVRDPQLLAQALRRHGLRAPRFLLNDPNDSNDSNDSKVEWLVKPFASGGGHGIRRWRGGSIPRRSYLQELVLGAPASIVFVAAAGRVAPLAISTQLIGDPAFGAGGFQYCGSILTNDLALFEPAIRLASALTEEFGLVGVNGIDFICRDEGLVTLEVNPRWCASMELVERAYGLSVFSAHASACRDGTLPSFVPGERRSPLGAVGKAIVFAKDDVVAPDTGTWLADDTVGDVPRPGERIAKGRPICTVFATGVDDRRCYAELVRRAERVCHEFVTAMV